MVYSSGIAYILLMSMMVIELYDALLEAGVSQDRARAAATAMSEEALATKGDIARLERETKSNFTSFQSETKGSINSLEHHNQNEFARLERELLIVNWMCGAIVAGVASIMVKTFFA